MKSTRKYTDIDEFIKNESKAIKSLITTLGGDTEPIDNMEVLVMTIRECASDSSEKTDSYYIIETYTVKTSDKKFKIEVVGKSYRKDHCVCEQEMIMEVTVIDMEILKQEKQIRLKQTK